ncbi:acyltransferase [Ralstonia solanacearum]|uniref:acyltransferase n=1 Tax=Ralstonia solanacearum TaxID=305 RepID=UPI0005055FA9|nr:acyltransferase family protein [Ralstonia solanacearum]KFX30789.1 membrane protein [Ralstonia solanacearum]
MPWIDAARVISIFAVVFLHISASVVTEADFGSSFWWHGNFYDSMVRWCVPVFVMISGALLLDESRVEDAVTFYKRRVGRILLPLIFWTIAFLFWNAIKARFSGAEFGLVQAVKSVASGKPHYHMWFLFMIFGLYLFTPLIRTLVRNAGRRELWFFVIVMFSLSALDELLEIFFDDEDGFFLFWFLPYIPYFICGHLIASSKRNDGKFISLVVFVASVFFTAIGFYFLTGMKGPEKGIYFYGNLSVSVIPMSIALMWLLRSLSFSERVAEWFGVLSALTLGIYLIHPIFLESFRFFYFKAKDYYPLLSVPALTVLIFGGSLMFAFVLRKTPYLKRVI